MLGFTTAAKTAAKKVTGFTTVAKRLPRKPLVWRTCASRRTMITVVWRAPMSRGAAPASVWSNHASSLHQGPPGTWHKPAAPRAQTIRYRHVRSVFRKRGTFGGCRGRRPVWGRRPGRVADPARLRNKMHLRVIGVSPAMLSSRCTPISNSEGCLWAMVSSQRIDVCMVCKCATFNSPNN